MKNQVTVVGVFHGHPRRNSPKGKDGTRSLRYKDRAQSFTEEGLKQTWLKLGASLTDLAWAVCPEGGKTVEQVRAN